MQERVKINVLIADRYYPMTVLKEEESAVRKAAKDIATALKEIELKYAVRDKQDALSMCLLQYASKMEVGQRDKQREEEFLCHSIRDIIKQMAEAL
ncbi:MAG: cell division protein ZapA [Flavobacteriales bacterium AspAUS03]